MNPSPRSTVPAPSHLAALLRQDYQAGSWLSRRLCWHRPRVCPFDLLIPHVPPGARVLDVGCGSGVWLYLLARTRRLGSGVGIDPCAVAIARAVAADDRLCWREPDAPPLRFVSQSAHEPLPAGPFDVVSLIDVMHHLPPDPAGRRDLIARLADLLPAGGKLIYKDMALRPRWRWLANQVHDLALAGQWVHVAPISQVEAWAAAARLTLAEAATARRWWYAHEIRVFTRASARA